jgi:hypothetical protein
MHEIVLVEEPMQFFWGKTTALLAFAAEQPSDQP